MENSWGVLQSLNQHLLQTLKDDSKIFLLTSLFSYTAKGFPLACFYDLIQFLDFSIFIPSGTITNDSISKYILYKSIFIFPAIIPRWLLFSVWLFFYCLYMSSLAFNCYTFTMKHFVYSRIQIIFIALYLYKTQCNKYYDY